LWRAAPAKAPAWIHQPTRSVDNGYIVYVEHADGPNLEKAQFKAEGMALEDIANECSIIPKGTRVEDRYSEKKSAESQGWAGFDAYAKIALEFQTCDEGSKAVEPEQIRKLASTPFTEELQRFQQFDETGEIPSQAETASIEPPEQIAPAPVASSTGGSGQFYVFRQYVAYQKQIVVLSPPTAYAPGSPQAAQFASTVTPAVHQVQTMAIANPTYRTNPTPWSKIPDRPTSMRPTALRSSPSQAQAPRMNQMSPSSREQFSPRQQARPVAPFRGNQGKGRGGRRRRQGR